MLKNLEAIKLEDPEDYLDHWISNGFHSELELQSAIESLETDIKKIRNKIVGIEDTETEKPKVSGLNETFHANILVHSCN